MRSRPMWSVSYCDATYAVCSSTSRCSYVAECSPNATGGIATVIHLSFQGFRRSSGRREAHDCVRRPPRAGASCGRLPTQPFGPVELDEPVDRGPHEGTHPAAVLDLALERGARHDENADVRRRL